MAKPAQLEKEQPTTGLFIKGTVIARSRRQFDKKGGGNRYNIALAIQTDDGVYKPERWTDLPTPADIPERGTEVNLPVKLTTYTTKSGTGFRLTWGLEASTEEF